jgi:hypothetical protein
LDAPATFTRAACIAIGLLLASCQPVRRAAAKGERTTVVVEDRRVVAHTGAEAIVLSEGLAAAGEPDLSFDGASVVFTGRRDGSSPPRLFVATLDGAQRHELDTGRDEPRTPCFLPDGGVVYATCDANGHLAAVGGTRSAPVRLTYGPGAQRDPTLLPDGRVLYVDVAAAGAHLAPARRPRRRDGRRSVRRPSRGELEAAQAARAQRRQDRALRRGSLRRRRAPGRTAPPRRRRAPR